MGFAVNIGTLECPTNTKRKAAVFIWLVLLAVVRPKPVR
jgi:hypothetical protein